MKNEKFDDLYTPVYAIEPLLKYLPKKKMTIWECCDSGVSNITKVLKNIGHDVISTDIKTGFNFLTDKPDFDFDIIITNPPYSLKNKFIKKCYEYSKPFALLLPIHTLEGIERGKMFKKHGISLIVLDKRINFVENKKGCWFNTSWFTWQLDEGNKLYFEEVIQNCCGCFASEFLEKWDGTPCVIKKG